MFMFSLSNMSTIIICAEYESEFRPVLALWPKRKDDEEIAFGDPLIDKISFKVTENRYF